MARKRKNRNSDKIIFTLLSATVFFIMPYVFYSPQEEPAIKDTSNFKEKDYVNAYCDGAIEYVLADKTRVDCLTDEYAIEFDYAKKWAESIGQALYYSKKTSKKPAVALIVKGPEDRKYVKRVETVEPDMKIFVIDASKEPKKGFYQE